MTKQEESLEAIRIRDTHKNTVGRVNMQADCLDCGLSGEVLFITECTGPKPLSLSDMIVPVAGRIAVLVDTRDEITPGGLMIPVETARSLHEEKPTQGKVIAIGEDVDDIEVGDHVIFGKFTGTRVRYQPKNPDGSTKGLDAQSVIIMDERSVLCKLLTPEQAKNLKIRG